MQDNIRCIFWVEKYQCLSGKQSLCCTTRQEALDMLFNGIAANESAVGYINDIYDNAEVEIARDNMKEVTVADHFDLRDIYAVKGEDAADVFSYASNGTDSVGLVYAEKRMEGPEPDFAEVLAEMNAYARRLLDRTHA